MIRIMLVSLFVFAGFMGVILLLDSLNIKGSMDWIVISVLMISLLALLILAYVGMNKIESIDWRHQHQSLQELSEKGLILSTDFTALRAFQIEEWEDEGTQYMIELANGSVLYLCGQYLDEYEPFEDGETNQPRRFPCTEFTVLRNKQTGDGLDLVCRGTVLEPECLAPPFDEKDGKHGLIPNDGHIYENHGYDEIKRERMKA